MNNNIILPAPYKISWVVKNLDEGMAAWEKQLGVSQWNTFEYEGEAKDIKVGSPFLSKFAQAPMGNGLTFEMVQPVKGDSVWQKFLDANGESFHLLSYSIPEKWEVIVESLKAQNATVLAEASFDGLRWCYIEVDACGLKRMEITEERPA